MAAEFDHMSKDGICQIIDSLRVNVCVDLALTPVLVEFSR